MVGQMHLSSDRDLTEPLSVVIAGSGFAAVEAGLALRALAADRVRLKFVSPQPILRYRPEATTEVFGDGPPRTYDLRAVAGQLKAEIRVARLQSVASKVRQARLSSGERLDYDALVLAIGSRAQNSIPGATTFRDQRDVPGLRRLLAGIETGGITRLVFAVPSGSSWPLPLYELALLAARHGVACGGDLDLTLVSSESEPLEIFGAQGSHTVADLLDEQGVRFRGGCAPLAVRRDGALELAGAAALPADAVVTIPQLTAHRIAGVPASWWGFVPTDRCGRVQDLDDVYAAGDMTAYPVKQGGLAAQQADRIANTIARGLGLPVREPDERLVLQAHLVGGDVPLFLRAELDWQGRPTAATASHLDHSAEFGSTKVLGRYLAPYLEELEPTAAEPVRP